MNPTDPLAHPVPGAPSSADQARFAEQDPMLRDIARGLGSLARNYRLFADRRVGALGLSDAVAWPLMTVARLGDGVRPGVVADELGVDPASLVRVIDQLVDGGLLSREEDPTDRRAKILRLTADGRERAERIERFLLTLRREVFAGIATEDLRACQRVFVQLAEVLARTPSKG